jgi:uracil-DNA glycosylase family protein
LQRTVRDCKGCALYADATQAVLGESTRSAPIVLVGEQPGDHDVKQRRPFGGPAGGGLWLCLDVAGIDRRTVFATNAVKNFKPEDRGKRRLHTKPNTAKVEVCHSWIDAELRAVEGRVIVALGATALRPLIGRSMSIAAGRVRTLPVGDRPAIVTYHPPAPVLRAGEAAAKIRTGLVADLRLAHRLAVADA